MKKVLLFGASGFIGRSLLDELLNNPAYSHVTIVVRRDLNIQHPKLTALIGDLTTLPSLKDQLVVDDVFITLGTTRKNTPDQQQYYAVDHDYPVAAARLARENGATTVVLLTAVSSNTKSRVFYIRTKGETERDVIALHYPHTLIFRPSMLMGHRQENRPMERAFIAIWNVINPLLDGPLSKYRGIKGPDLAKAMSKAANPPSGQLTIYHWKEMKALLDQP